MKNTPSASATRSLGALREIQAGLAEAACVAGARAAQLALRLAPSARRAGGVAGALALAWLASAAGLGALSLDERPFAPVSAEAFTEAKEAFSDLAAIEVTWGGTRARASVISDPRIGGLSRPGAAFAALSPDRTRALMDFGREALRLSHRREKAGDFKPDELAEERERRARARRSMEALSAAQARPFVLKTGPAMAIALSGAPGLGWVESLAPQTAQLAQHDADFHSAAARMGVFNLLFALLAVSPFLIALGRAARWGLRRLRSLGREALALDPPAVLPAAEPSGPLKERASAPATRLRSPQPPKDMSEEAAGPVFQPRRILARPGSDSAPL